MCYGHDCAMSNSTVIAVTITKNKTTRTIASSEFSESHAFLEPNPVVLGDLSPQERQHMLGLVGQVPRWVEQGIGEVAYNLTALAEWADKIAAAVKYLEAAKGVDETKANRALIELHELVYSENK